jgi:hypothetical protein
MSPGCESVYIARSDPRHLRRLGLPEERETHEQGPGATRVAGSVVVVQLARCVVVELAHSKNASRPPVILYTNGVKRTSLFIGLGKVKLGSPEIRKWRAL